MSISGTAINRPVTTIMLIISMIGMGLMGLAQMPIDRMPNMAIPIVTVSTTWVGASPEEIDTLITKKIEDIIPNVEGVTKQTTTSQQNASVVIIEFEYGVDVDDKVTLVQNQISQIENDLPSDADAPVISKANPNAEPIVNISLTGPDPLKTRSYAENRLKPAFQKLNGAGNVEVFGGYEREVKIELNPNTLESFGLSIDEVYNIINASSMSIPAGTVEQGDKNYVMRVMGELKTLQDVKNILITNKKGNTLYLNEIADISLTNKKIDSYSRQDGEPSVTISITKTDSGSSVQLAKDAKAEIERLKTTLPSGMDLKLSYDASIMIVNSINNVMSSAVMGLILASVVLFVFLKDLRATLVIATAIPVSIICTFLFLNMAGVTLNVVSLMGLSLGIGMLVDNGVVVLDNIFRHMTELKKPKLEAARDGAAEMLIPMIASTATTVAVFLPVVFTNGLAKEIFFSLSLAICFALGVSLIVASTLVPMASSRILNENKDLQSEGWILKLIKKFYVGILRICIRVPVLTLIISVAACALIVMVGLKTLSGGFLPETDDNIYTVSGEAPPGVNIKKMDEIARQVEEILKEDEMTKSYNMNVTSDGFTMQIDVPGKKERSKSVWEIVDDTREKLKYVPDVKLNIKAAAGSGPGGGGGGVDRGITVEFLGDDIPVLEEFSKSVFEKMKGASSLSDLASTLEGGNPEAKIVIDRGKARYYGVNIASLNQVLSYQILGGTATTIKTDTEEVDVNVQLPESYRESLAAIMESRIKGNNGDMIKLKEIAEIKIEEGPAMIEKTDRTRKITLGANTKSGVATTQGQAEIKEIIDGMDIPASVTYKFAGEGEDMATVGIDLGISLGIAIFLIYLILASQFESFILPAIIMGSVPLSVAGVVLGLIVTKQGFNMMVMIGIIMLAGVVVNNAIVFIDYTKILRDRGEELIPAIEEAGKTRMRPIFMTTATTILGMLPLALGIGEGSEMYQSMAIAVIFGLMFSTVLTLLIIPVLYTLVEKWAERFSKLFGGRKRKKEEKKRKEAEKKRLKEEKRRLKEEKKNRKKNKKSKKDFEEDQDTEEAVEVDEQDYSDEEK